MFVLPILNAWHAPAGVFNGISQVSQTLRELRAHGDKVLDKVGVRGL
jgi:hypothetical protein